LLPSEVATVKLEGEVVDLVSKGRMEKQLAPHKDKDSREEAAEFTVEG
jgi:hypothetical protein